MRIFDPSLLHFTSLWLSATNCFWQFTDRHFSLPRVEEDSPHFSVRMFIRYFYEIYTLCSSFAFSILPNLQGVGPIILMSRLKIQVSFPAEKQKQIIRIFNWAGLKTINWFGMLRKQESCPEFLLSYFKYLFRVLNKSIHNWTRTNSVWTFLCTKTLFYIVVS